MSARALASTIVLAVALWSASGAQAAFTEATLVSGSPALQLQADYAYEAVISASGEYVAFTGSVASQPGVYRKDLGTGALELVAAGAGTDTPSLSANGRYVSFTTDEEPATGQSLGAAACNSVYVRDMSLPPSSPGAYALASAADGSSESLTYAPPAAGKPCGSAAGRGALSADGRRVAFTVLSPSDLTDPSTPAEPNTPPDQVVLRDLSSQRTTLVSTTLASLGDTPQAVPGGAAIVSPVASVALNGIALPVALSTAAISADGTTVAWMGMDIPLQAPIPPLSGTADATTFPYSYAEPLWRRIADGPAAPTRRILAGDDASASECPPACPGGLDLLWDREDLGPYATTGAGPAYGSYLAPDGFVFGGFLGSVGTVTPQLSANGMTVAILSTQPNYGQDPNFGLLNATRPPPANAFVANMAPGLTRAQAITRLTAWGSLDFAGKNAGLTGPVTSIAISPDGTRVAFTTERIVFPLAPPALITPPLSQVVAPELYEANLHAGTLALVSQGYDGQPANGAVSGASFDGDGGTLAFSSSAGNLAYGAVSQGSDVFITHEIASPPLPGQQSLGPAPVEPAIAPPWSLSATIEHRTDGSLVVDVAVPGAGNLKALASASAPALAQAARRAHSRAGARHGAARARSTPAGARAHRDTTVAMRLIAQAQASAAEPELIELRLTPATGYRALERARGGLYATIVLTFEAAGRRRLSETLQASFLAGGGHAHSTGAKHAPSRAKSTRARHAHKPAKHASRAARRMGGATGGRS